MRSKESLWEWESFFKDFRYSFRGKIKSLWDWFTFINSIL